MKYIICLLTLISIGYGVEAEFLPEKYKELYKVGEFPKPDISVESQSLCGIQRMLSKDENSPHGEIGLVYYINEVAKSIRSEKSSENIKFQVGSVIVKEKWNLKSDQLPTVITVMVKINDNPNISSWSFDMYDPITFKNITSDYHKRSPISCIECHSNWKGSDYLSPKGLKFISKVD